MTKRADISPEAMLSFVQLAAGLSHQLSNPLAAILGYAELLLRRNLDPEIRPMLEHIHGQAERCKQLLQSLNAMVRRPSQGFFPVDVHQMIEEALSSRRAELSAHGIEVLVRTQEGPLVVTADALGLQEVLRHLLDNAEQALESHPGKRTICIGTGLNEGRALIRIEDTGPGIKPDVLPRIFEPFFTTSKDNRIGLGLTLCHSILQQHGGTIEVDSTEGEGTRVLLYFRLQEQSAPRREKQSSADLSGKNVLVVEDEGALGQLLMSLLSSVDARAVRAVNGAEALELIRSRDFDVIISDIQMPQMSGTDLYRQLATEKPELADRTILITGDPASERSELLLQGVKASLLYKPFSRAQLLETVSRVLAGKAS
jgi:CheY-like chemotaxis protein